MTLLNDLEHLIQSRFDELGIHCEKSLSINELAQRYFEMCMRMVDLKPRRLHFSDQVKAALKRLDRETTNRSKHPVVHAVRRLGRTFQEGGDVNKSLSQNIQHASSFDGLFWHYGIHHFHLGKKQEQDRFDKRSKYLLYAVVRPNDVYFIDVRRHPRKRNRSEWVREALLETIDNNWPFILNKYTVNNVKGDNLTDEQKSELRRKNINFFPEINGKAIMPIYGGLTGAGRSALCLRFADELVFELNHHEQTFADPKIRLAVSEDLKLKGYDIDSEFEIELVFVEDLDLSDELMKLFKAEDCDSKSIFNFGFFVVERQTRSPIHITVLPSET